MSEPTERENIEAGMERLERIAASFDEELLEAAAAAEFADRARRQPWLVAGVSDGMGLHVTVAAIESGLVEQGVGVYYEPPALLKTDDEGDPVSSVHWARYQNALALEVFAEERGVDLRVLSSDMLLAPQRGLKGDVKGDIPEFPDDVRESFEGMRGRAEISDAVFIDSVAFGKWICPREGEDSIEVPNVDFQGRIVSAETKKYHPRGYQETLDTMGRNHGRLLERLREFGWLGEEALTAFFTWAGGSQNVEVLDGIYGRGSLGDAKIIAERDVVEFRLEHGLELGEHAIVRLPAFLSAALMAIPGGGLFGLVSRKTLKEHGVHRDIPELAARMLRRLFGPEWVRRNPIAQIELDANESLHLSEIADRVAEAQKSIREYRRQQPEEERDEPIPTQKSAELLEGYVPWNYRSILGRFRPGEEAEGSRAEFEVDGSARELSDRLKAPVGSTTLAAFRRVTEVDPAVQRGVRSIRDRFEPAESGSGTGAWGRGRDERLRGGVEIGGDGGGPERRIGRTVVDEGGGRIGSGETELSEEPAEFESLDWIGDPAGVSPQVSREDLEELTEGGSFDQPLVRAGAVVAFGEAALVASGRVGGGVSAVEWTVDLEALSDLRGGLGTYARRLDDALVATVVDERGEPVGRLRLFDE